MAKAQNKIVLWLPPYHCELNPIKLIWADIKKFVAEHNSTFKFADMKNIFHNAISRQKSGRNALITCRKKWNKKCGN